VASANGTAPDTADHAVVEGRDADCCGKRSPLRPISETPQRRYAVTSGRLAVGSVEVIDRRTFLAVDVDGNTIGRFPTLKLAVAALPDGGSSTS
jgi:hypothetical protein